MTTDQAREGLSLASITHIAANPPAAFDESNFVLEPSLVLYIARVPGSRDVFLTTLKPRQKVVTAEDVQSCLYYVHASQVDDHDRYGLVNTDGDGSHQARSPDIDTSSGYAFRVRSNNVHSSEERTIRRKPLNDSFQVRRKPLPQQPQTEEHVSGLWTSAPMKGARPLPALPPESDVIDGPQRTSLSDNIWPAVPVSFETAADTLTLIRRDPGTNLQWNVAKISNVDGNSGAGSMNGNASKRKAPRGPLHVDIVNENYGRFQEEGSTAHNRQNMTRSHSLSSQGVFQRSVHMPSSDHQTSYETTQALARAQEGSRQSLLSSETSNRKGPIFVSPWGDHCEFVTGITGKSLKCRYPAANTDLSELRFNLPMTTRRADNPGQGERTKVQFKRFSFNPDRSSARDTARTPQDDHEALDLTLGREQAGGGFGGKHAKLGKLIVESPGLKMLDLLVAANIGLWWRTYERCNN